MNSSVEAPKAASLKSKTKAVAILGIGDDGCLSLSPRAAGEIAKAQVLVGGERHLEFFPEFQGLKIVVKNNLAELVSKIEELARENHVVVLASGDPLFFGIGSLIVKKLGIESVEILPHAGSMQLAFSKIGMKWDDAVWVSLHGRPIKGLVTRIKDRRKIALFTDPENSPSRIARYLLDYGEKNLKAWVSENLGGAGERVREFSLEDLAECRDISDLNILILLGDDSWSVPASIPFLHEDAFAKRMPKKGLITKREVRLLSLGFLNLKRDSVVWDIGAGSGSVSIEAAMICREGEIYAVETDPEGAAICRENLLTHRIDNVTVLEGLAPEALTGLPQPDAVFIGGSKGNMRPILDYALAELREEGRLVVNAITFENVQEAYSYFKEKDLNPEVILLNVARGEPLARYLRYEALNPIHIFAVGKGNRNREVRHDTEL